VQALASMSQPRKSKEGTSTKGSVGVHRMKSTARRFANGDQIKRTYTDPYFLVPIWLSTWAVAWDYQQCCNQTEDREEYENPWIFLQKPSSKVAEKNPKSEVVKGHKDEIGLTLRQGHGRKKDEPNYGPKNVKQNSFLHSDLPLR